MLIILNIIIIYLLDLKHTKYIKEYNLQQFMIYFLYMLPIIKQQNFFLYQYKHLNDPKIHLLQLF